MKPDEPLDPSVEGISRRRMLKRIGAGAAIAWSAPVLTSLRSPAFGQTTPPTGECDLSTGCNSNTCSACPFLESCQDNSNCQCWMASPDNGNVCVCKAFVAFCGDTPLCPNGQQDCTDAGVPDYCCVQTCCGQLCAPQCGTQVRKSKKAGAKTTK
jgi:hypothetical protein